MRRHKFISSPQSFSLNGGDPTAHVKYVQDKPTLSSQNQYPLELPPPHGGLPLNRVCLRSCFIIRLPYLDCSSS
jgi:hypothetical protein